jgi:hypothetical protein
LLDPEVGKRLTHALYAGGPHGKKRGQGRGKRKGEKATRISTFQETAEASY